MMFDFDPVPGRFGIDEHWGSKGSGRKVLTLEIDYQQLPPIEGLCGYSGQ
ncbi:MAG: hypothetical protein R3C56_40130 [Pirellulaceae bacterium]